MKKYIEDEFSTLSSTLNRTLGSKTPRNTQIQILSQLFPKTLTHKPVIEQKVIENLIRKAQIDKKVKDQVNYRERKDNFYIQYDYNPFMVHKKNLKIDTTLSVKNKRMKNIIENVRHKTTTPPLKIQKKTVQAITKFDKMKQNFASQSFTNIYTLQRKKVREHQELIYNKENKTKNADFNREYQQDYSKISLQAILSIKEESFFSNRQNQCNKINIFKILICDESCLNPFEKLKEKNFTFNGMIDRISNLKIPIYREISHMGWGVITGTYKGKQHPSNHILSNQMIIHVNELTYGDIMNIASNRFTPQLSEKLITERSNDGNLFMQLDSEQGHKIKVILPKTMKNFGDNYDFFDLQIQQIQNWKNLDYNTQQAECISNLGKQENEIIKILQFQQQLCAKTIKQPNLQFMMTQDVKKIIKGIISEGQTKIQCLDIDKKIRKNKRNNDKRQLIQVKFMKELLKKKYHYQRVHDLIARKGVNKKIFNQTM